MSIALHTAGPWSSAASGVERWQPYFPAERSATTKTGFYSETGTAGSILECSVYGSLEQQCCFTAHGLDLQSWNFTRETTNSTSPMDIDVIGRFNSPVLISHPPGLGVPSQLYPNWLEGLGWANFTAPVSLLPFGVINCGGSGYSSVSRLWECFEALSSAVATMYGNSTERLIGDLAELRDLRADWDGEGAAAPLAAAIDDAISFVRIAGNLAGLLEPTPDVDGSVLLEIGDGSEGSLRFRGDHTIIYAIPSAAPGAVVFDGKNVPKEISGALAAAL